MSQDFFKELDRIVETATRLSLLEALGTEDEEKMRQKKLEDELSALKSGSKKSSKDEVEEGEEAAAEAPETDKKDPETPTPAIPTEEEVVEATVDDIVDKLNMLRSGKSTKDEEVRDQLAAYWDTMQPGEQQSLFAYLTGLTQIMTAGAVGADATDPSSVGIKISAKKKSRDQEERQEPAKDLSDEQKKADEKGSEEAPIIVGESISKRQLLKRVKELMR